MGALQQCFGSSAERRVGPGDMGQRRSRAVDQQLAKISVWLRSRVPRPAIGPYVRLCSARRGYDDPQSTTVRLEIRCATIVERARSCLDRRTLLSRRGPRRPEQRPRAAMGATGNAPTPAGRPALRQRLSVRRHLSRPRRRRWRFLMPTPRRCSFISMRSRAPSLRAPMPC